MTDAIEPGTAHKICAKKHWQAATIQELAQLQCPACHSLCMVSYCMRCAHRWLPAQVRSETNYAGISNRNPTGNRHLEKKIEDRVRFLSDFLSDGMRILEIGCAEGSIGKVVKSKLEVTYSGVEPSPDGQKASSSLDMVYSGLEEFKSTRHQFDLILSFHVLEHIADPLDALRSWRSLLSQDGKVIIEVPNRSGHRDIAIDQNPEHIHQFSVASLCLHASAAGLDVESITTGNFESPVYSDSIRLIARKTETDAQKTLRLKAKLRSLGPRFAIYGLGGDFSNYVYPAISRDLEIFFIDEKIRDLFSKGIEVVATPYCRETHGEMTVLVSTIHHEESIVKNLISQGHNLKRIVRLADLMNL